MLSLCITYHDLVGLASSAPHEAWLDAKSDTGSLFSADCVLQHTACARHENEPINA